MTPQAREKMWSWVRTLIACTISALITGGGILIAAGQRIERIDQLQATVDYHMKTEYPDGMRKLEEDHDAIAEIRTDVQVIKTQIQQVWESQKRIERTIGADHP